MTSVNWLHRLLSPKKAEFAVPFMLPIEEQIRAWRKATQKMKLGIGEKEFGGPDSPSALTANDL